MTDVRIELAEPWARQPLHSPIRIMCRRFAADRWSLAAAIVFAFVLLASFAGGPAVSRIEGHNGFDQFPYATTQAQKPVGPWTWVPDLNYATGNTVTGELTPPPAGVKKTLMVFGADGPLGRDELIRVLDGGKTSLEIAICAVVIALLAGVPIGAAGGYYGGVVDAVVSRITETVMAFPLMLFLIFASVRLDRTLDPIGLVGGSRTA